MSIITFPTNLDQINIIWSQKRNDMAFESSFGSQAVENSAPQWKVSLTPIEMLDAAAGALQALYMKLRGRTNQLALWNTVRPAPLGTMRGSMVLADDLVQGDITMLITASGQGAKTLLQGDFLGFGSGTTQQVVMLTADATSDGSGNITVTFEPPARNTILTGSPPAAVVTWDKPCALFRIAQSELGWSYGGGTLVSGMPMELIEDWRA